MFYALITIGIIFIIVGVKNYIPEQEQEQEPPLLTFELDDLKFRIENLEKEFYENKTRSFEDVVASTDLSFNSVENYKKVREYEKENLSIEEISELLDMNKGEVILLKNLYKNQES